MGIAIPDPAGSDRIPDKVLKQPDKVRKQIVELALEEPELSPRELAVRFTVTRRYFVSEASFYLILKAQDLITNPAGITIKAVDEFYDKTVRPN